MHTVDAKEIEIFAKDSSRWWDENGPFRPLHRLNPVRLAFIKEQICAHWKRDTLSFKPYNGLSILDIGCGGGLVCEPMARLGADVTGVDADIQAIAVAQDHAKMAGLKIDYRAVSTDTLLGRGPSPKPSPKGEGYEIVSVGPTTSMRMEKFEYEFVKKTGVRVIVGKGGMKENTERACREFGAIHCVFPAGNAVVAATEVEEVVEAQWKDLGMPETLWHCHVKNFGPLIVSIDAYGKNFFEEKKVEYNKRKEKKSRLP